MSEEMPPFREFTIPFCIDDVRALLKAIEDKLGDQESKVSLEEKDFTFTVTYNEAKFLMKALEEASEKILTEDRYAPKNKAYAHKNLSGFVFLLGKFILEYESSNGKE